MGSRLWAQDVLGVNMFCIPQCFWMAEGKDKVEWGSGVNWSSVPGSRALSLAV